MAVHGVEESALIQRPAIFLPHHLGLWVGIDVDGELSVLQKSDVLHSTDATVIQRHKRLFLCRERAREREREKERERERWTERERKRERGNGNERDRENRESG